MLGSVLAQAASRTQSCTRVVKRMEGRGKEGGRLIWNSSHAARSLFPAMVEGERAGCARCSAASIKRWDWAENAFFPPLLSLSLCLSLTGNTQNEEVNLREVRSAIHV